MQKFELHGFLMQNNHRKFCYQLYLPVLELLLIYVEHGSTMLLHHPSDVARRVFDHHDDAGDNQQNCGRGIEFIAVECRV